GWVQHRVLRLGRVHVGLAGLDREVVRRRAQPSLPGPPARVELRSHVQEDGQPAAGDAAPGQAQAQHLGDGQEVNPSRSRGVTFMELIITISVMSVLLAGAAVAVGKYGSNGR